MITVAIAFHDEERYLAAAIRSVLAQTHRDFELLLIDDGSADRSIDVARGFLDDPRVQLFSDGKRRHLAARLNETISRARGDLIARMDADDVIHPEKLALQVAHLTQNPKAMAVGTWAALIGEDEQVFAISEASPTPTDGTRILERGVIAHATMLARAAWLRAHPYDESLTRAEDRDLWCRVALDSQIDAIEDVLYVIRVIPERKSFLRDYLRGQADLRRVIRRHGPTLVGRSPTRRMISASFLKSIAMTGATMVGASKRIVHRRGRKPTAAELARVAEALRASRG